MGNQCTGPGGQLQHDRRRSATSASFNTDSLHYAFPTKEPRGTESKNHPKKNHFHHLSFPHPPRALLFLRPDASPRSPFSSSVPSTSNHAYSTSYNNNNADFFDIRKTASSLSLGPSSTGGGVVSSPIQGTNHYMATPPPSSTLDRHPDRLSGDDDDVGRQPYIAHHNSATNDIAGEVDQLGFSSSTAEPFYLGGSEAECKRHEAFHQHHHHHHDDEGGDASATTTGFGVEDDFCQLSKRFRTKRFRTRLELGIL